MDEKLIIDIARLDPDGESISGEVDAVDLNEEFVKPFGGIRYELDVKLYGKSCWLEEPRNRTSISSVRVAARTSTIR